jgi:enamine deaminase RidA (YjgF/YER057c/UK114 family)
MPLVEDRLSALGLTLPDVAAPVAAYVPAVRTGNLVYTSGQLPFVDGALPDTGKLGADITPDRGNELASICALNAMAAIKALIGDLDKVVRVVKVVGFVNSTPDFSGHPAVVNGASNLLLSAFGDAGVHARSAVGVAALPLNAPVEVELIVEVVD